jgi:hypothetical protein
MALCGVEWNDDWILTCEGGGEVGWGGMDWIDVAEDSGRWRAFMNAVMNFLVP